MNLNINVVLNSWGRYNEGLQGTGWLKLEEIDFENIHKKLGEEIFIQDSEGDIELGENDFHLLERLDDLEYDISEDLFLAVAEWEGIESAIEMAENDNYDNYQFIGDIDNDEDFGEWYIETFMEEIPSHLEFYIDYEKLGRDKEMEFTGRYVTNGYIYKN